MKVQLPPTKLQKGGSSNSSASKDSTLLRLTANREINLRALLCFLNILLTGWWKPFTDFWNSALPFRYEITEKSQWREYTHWVALRNSVESLLLPLLLLVHPFLRLLLLIRLFLRLTCLCFCLCLLPLPCWLLCHSDRGLFGLILNLDNRTCSRGLCTACRHPALALRVSVCKVTYTAYAWASHRSETQLYNSSITWPTPPINVKLFSCVVAHSVDWLLRSLGLSEGPFSGISKHSVLCLHQYSIDIIRGSKFEKYRKIGPNQNRLIFCSFLADAFTANRIELRSNRVQRTLLPHRKRLLIYYIYLFRCNRFPVRLQSTIYPYKNPWTSSQSSLGLLCQITWNENQLIVKIEKWEIEMFRSSTCPKEFCSFR